MIRQLERAIKPLANRVRSLVERVVVTRVTVGGNGVAQSIQARAGGSNVHDGIAHPQPSGFASYPLSGAEAIVFWPGGARELGIALVVDDRRGRPLLSEPGECTVFNPVSGAMVKMAADGTIQVTGDLIVEGDIRAAGDLSDGTSTLEEIRQLYNLHTHGTSTGPTTPPTPQLGGTATAVNGGGGAPDADPVAGGRGLNAYELAILEQGFVGDVETWLISLKGPKGDQGDAGAQGIQGVQGDPGPPGANGAQGTQGLQGKIGAQGNIGPQGDVGPKGDQGIQGTQGDPGNDGAQGVQGDPGNDGSDALALGGNNQTLTSSRVITDGGNGHSLNVSLSSGSTVSNMTMSPAIGLISLAASNGTKGGSVFLSTGGINLSFSGTGQLLLNGVAAAEGEILAGHPLSNPRWIPQNVHIGPSAPANTGRLWFNTSSGVNGLFFRDSVRGKWLSDSFRTVDLGRVGTIASGVGHYVRLAGPRDSNHNLTQKLGVIIPFDGTVVAWGFSTKNDTTAWTHRLGRYDKSAGTASTVVTAAPAGNYDNWSDETIDIDVNAGDLLGCSAINGVAAIVNQQYYLVICRRAA